MAWYDYFVAFDTETTGVDNTARIIELAVVHFYKGGVVREWTQLLHPNNVEWDSPKVKEALFCNKLTFEQLKGQPLFEEVRLELMQELSEEVWVAHNPDFDVRMLDQELKRIGETLEHKPDIILDTMSLDCQLNPEAQGRKLRDVAPRWGVPQEDAHRAVVDATVCGNILYKMAPQLPQNVTDLIALQKRAAREWQQNRGRKVARAV